MMETKEERKEKNQNRRIMWAGVLTHILLLIIIVLLVSQQLKFYNFMSTCKPTSSNNSNATAKENPIVKQKLETVGLTVQHERKLSENVPDPIEALIAAERANARYETLKLLDLPFDSDDWKKGEKVAQLIRNNLPSSSCPQQQQHTAEEELFLAT